MIDRIARIQYASLVRRLVAGQLATDDFQCHADRVTASIDDLALNEIATLIDGTFHDLWSYRLSGRHRLPAETRRIVARCLLFLYGDEPVTKPVPAVRPDPLGLLDVPLALLAIAGFVVGLACGVVGVIGGLGLLSAWLLWVHRRELRHAEQVRESWLAERVWPFPDERSYRRACACPVFLTGSALSR